MIDSIDHPDLAGALGATPTRIPVNTNQHDQESESPVSLVDPISAADALSHTRHGDAVVVDARPQIVRHQGSLPGAVVVDPTDVGERLAPTASGAFPVIGNPDTEINVVSVSSQAPRIAEQIAGLGYTNVRYVDGGFRALRGGSTS